MTLTQLLTIVATTIIALSAKELIFHFFSPNKKVNKREYLEDKKMIHERIDKNRILSDESFKACKQACMNYTDRAIDSQKNEMGAIKELLQTELKGLNKRFDDLMRFLQKE